MTFPLKGSTSEISSTRSPKSSTRIARPPAKGRAPAAPRPNPRGRTVLTIQGPRFSTRAESKWFQEMGWDMINMTAYPEGYLARELELCYANSSMVTDHDVGVEGAAPVSHERVVR